MRILFITNFYPPFDPGGWEQNCAEMVQRLTMRGHECLVLTSRHGSEGQPSYEENAVRELYLQADIHFYRPVDFFLNHLAEEEANQQALRRVLDSFQPDAIFIWGMWNLSPRVGYWAEQWMPGKVAYAVAGYWFILPDPHESYWRQRARRPLARALLAPARHFALRMIEEEKARYPLALENVACVSDYVRRKLMNAGILRHGARVIYNGVDPEPFVEAAARRTASPDALRLVYTGNLVAHKGVHTAIEALGISRKQSKIDGLHLTVVGAGHPDYEARLQQLVKDHELQDYVTFLGRVPRREIADILAVHDVFLFTSVYEEPIARSVMEAMAAGLAVIGTPVGGQPEIMNDGVNALLYPPDDAALLAGCILQLKLEPKQRSRLAAAGQQTVLERFTLDRMVDEMEAWLEEIVH